MSIITKSEIRDSIVRTISEISEVPASEISPDEPLDNLGLGSSDILIIAGDLEDVTGLEIEADLLFQYRTINKLSDLLLSRLAAEENR